MLPTQASEPPITTQRRWPLRSESLRLTPYKAPTGDRPIARRAGVPVLCGHAHFKAMATGQPRKLCRWSSAPLDSGENAARCILLGHYVQRTECPLSGVKRTPHGKMSANDPKRTSRAHAGCFCSHQVCAYFELRSSSKTMPSWSLPEACTTIHVHGAPLLLHAAWGTSAGMKT
jgi:hypothetical protein